MKSKDRLIFYLLLNIFISAVTTLTVLWIWEKTHPRNNLLGPQPTSNTSVIETMGLPDPETPSPDPTLNLIEDDPQVTIWTVVGAGNLGAEYVEIHNQSDGAVDLSNWQLKDGDGNQFKFPALLLNQDGAIKVYTKSGTNTVIELYWNAESPIWQSGETVQLLDSSENLISTYTIP